MSFREPNGVVMTANMKLLGMEKKDRGPGRSAAGFATNQNGQAAKGKKQNVVLGGLDTAKTILASGSGRSVFRLTSPSIGLPSCT
jgi:hypothetical protein